MLSSIIIVCDFTGILAFAATGALVAGQKRMDAFGGLVLAVVTGVGGGTLRDMILDVPVFWLRESDALLACMAGFGICWAVLLLRRKPHLPRHITKIIQWLDALGLALFTVIGARKGLLAGESAGVAIVMGVLTGIGGGILRDVLANRVPLVLSRIRFYATASFCGAAVFVLLWTFGPAFAFGAGFAVTLVLRVGALVYDWRLPMFPAYQETE